MPGVDEAAGDMGRGEGQGLLREGQRVDMLLRARCSSSPWWRGVGQVEFHPVSWEGFLTNRKSLLGGNGVFF